MSASKKDYNWISPKVIPQTPNKHHVTALSDRLLINDKGTFTTGFYVKRLQNINSQKAGTGYFSDMHENELKHVLGYYPTKGIVKLLGPVEIEKVEAEKTGEEKQIV